MESLDDIRRRAARFAPVTAAAFPPPRGPYSWLEQLEAAGQRPPDNGTESPPRLVDACLASFARQIRGGE